jgi:hypothetical protein
LSILALIAVAGLLGSPESTEEIAVGVTVGSLAGVLWGNMEARDLAAALPAKQIVRRDRRHPNGLLGLIHHHGLAIILGSFFFILVVTSFLPDLTLAAASGMVVVWFIVFAEAALSHLALWMSFRSRQSMFDQVLVTPTYWKTWLYKGVEYRV